VATGIALTLVAGLSAHGLEQVLSTCAGGSGNPWNGVAVQHFTVPYGCTATKVEFRCDTARARHLPDHTVVVQIYSADREHIATNGADASLFCAAPGWLAVDKLALTSGQYFAQMFSNSQALQALLQARLAVGSSYRGGYAASGWQGGVPLGLGEDFEVRITLNRPPPTDRQPSAATGVLLKAGVPACAIVLATDSQPGEWTAAEELRDGFRQMTGADLPILLEQDCPEVPRVAVGFNPRLPAPLQSSAFGQLSEQEIIIQAHGEVLLLAGEGPSGTLYAVYELLHRLGVRWYSPEFTVAPRTTELLLPAEAVRYSPPVVHRTLTAGIGLDPRWAARNRLTSIAHWGALGRALGRADHEGPDMHTVWRMVPAETLRQHPDWVAEVQGQRVAPVNPNTWDLCYTNAEARRFLIGRTLEWARHHPDCKTVWIGQNDSPLYCSCSPCSAFYHAHGDRPAAVIVQLVNELADALLADGMSDRLAKTLAYGWSAEPPAGMVVRDNAVIMVCSAEQVAAWRRIARHVSVYLYGPSSDYWLPLPTLYPDAERLAAAVRAGARGLYQQISGFGGSYGSDMVHLRAWLTARLMWDPGANAGALLQDSCRGFYGPAAAVMEESLRLRHELFVPDRQRAEENPVVPGLIDPAGLRQINRLLEDAYNTLPEGDFRSHLGMAWIATLWADFWLGYQGIGRYDPESSTWSVPMADGVTRNRYGTLAKRLLAGNRVDALGEGNRLDPAELALDKMGVSWPAHLLRDGTLGALVVPGVGGLVAELRDAATGFAPLKPCWGGLILRYPLFSATGEAIGDTPVRDYQVAEASPTAVLLTSSLAGARLEKAVRLTDGQLQVAIVAVGDHGVAAAPSAAVMLDLLPQGLGTHPTLAIQRQDGTFSRHQMGTETDFWWVEGTLDMAEATGLLIIASESRPEGVELTLKPQQLAALDFWYDRKQGVYRTPEQHAMLRLFLRGQRASEARLDYSLRLLPETRR
jgi:hypothetical protein